MGGRQFEARLRRRISHVSSTIRIRFGEVLHAKFDRCLKRRISHVFNSIRLDRCLELRNL